MCLDESEFVGVGHCPMSVGAELQAWRDFRGLKDPAWAADMHPGANHVLREASRGGVALGSRSRFSAACDQVNQNQSQENAVPKRAAKRAVLQA